MWQQETDRPQRTMEELKKTVKKLSRQIMEITTKAGSGHPSSSLSAIDVMTALYFGGIMRYRPDEPAWPDRDRFILSKGHGVPGLYAVLAEAGFFEESLLKTLRETGSPLEGHPNMRRVAGLEASTGSLGQGLSLGIGHALGARVDGRDYRVYVMIGDGESEEGQVWEATMGAAKLGLDNLTCILDHNGYQQTGAMPDVMPPLTPLVEKWKVFGWDAVEIDGHDMQAVLEALKAARTVQGRPQMIVARTKKGRGLSPFEKDETSHKHGKALDEDELKAALEELEHSQS